MDNSNIKKGAGVLAALVGVLLWFVGGLIGAGTGRQTKR